MNEDLKIAFHEHLDRQITNKTFPVVWSALNFPSSPKASRTIRTRLLPVVIILILVGVMSSVFAGYSMLVRRDKTNLPFKDDPEIIGVWESVDFVQRPEDFIPTQRSLQRDLYLNKVYIGANGTVRCSVEDYALQPSSITWTKGHLLSKQDNTDSAYEIRDIGDSTYMFFEWKSGDYSFRGMDPWIYILKKIGDQDMTSEPLSRTKTDAVDQPFIDNPAMLGNWISVDFVHTPDDFIPNEKQSYAILYLSGLFLGDNGVTSWTLAHETDTGEIDHEQIDTSWIFWTKGLIVDKQSETASRCEIRTLDGTDYLFYEWKSGDYIYGGRKPSWYVFKRVQ